MKYVLVSDEIGNAVYFDHPDGRMLCLPMGTTQDMLRENFSEYFRVIDCGSVKFVFQQYENMLFALVSDHGESEIMLRRELHLIHQIFLFVFGGRLYQYMRDQRHHVIFAAKHRLRRLIDMASYMLEKQQSYMLQAVEFLNVNEDLRHLCSSTLEESLKNAQLRSGPESGPVTPGAMPGAVPPSLARGTRTPSALESASSRVAATTDGGVPSTAGPGQPKSNEAATPPSPSVTGASASPSRQLGQAQAGESLPPRAHALLFVGLRLVARARSPLDGPPLLPSDILLLVTTLQSLFDPYVRQHDEDLKPPAADYTGYAQALAASGLTGGADEKRTGVAEGQNEAAASRIDGKQDTSDASARSEGHAHTGRVGRSPSDLVLDVRGSSAIPSPALDPTPTAAPPEPSEDHSTAETKAVVERKAPAGGRALSAVEQGGQRDSAIAQPAAANVDADQGSTGQQVVRRGGKKTASPAGSALSGLSDDLAEFDADATALTRDDLASGAPVPSPMGISGTGQGKPFDPSAVRTGKSSSPEPQDGGVEAGSFDDETVIAQAEGETPAYMEYAYLRLGPRGQRRLYTAYFCEIVKDARLILVFPRPDGQYVPHHVPHTATPGRSSPLPRPHAQPQPATPRHSQTPIEVPESGASHRAGTAQAPQGPPPNHAPADEGMLPEWSRWGSGPEQDGATGSSPSSAETGGVPIRDRQTEATVGGKQTSGSTSSAPAPVPEPSPAPTPMGRSAAGNGSVHVNADSSAEPGSVDATLAPSISTVAPASGTGSGATDASASVTTAATPSEPHATPQHDSTASSGSSDATLPATPAAAAAGSAAPPASPTRAQPQIPEAEEAYRLALSDVCGRVKDQIKTALASYIDYLLIRGSTHVTMMSYVHQFPGLIHFLLVDRTEGQVIAPAIVPLHGLKPRRPSAVKALGHLPGGNQSGAGTAVPVQPEGVSAGSASVPAGTASPAANVAQDEVIDHQTCIANHRSDSGNESRRNNRRVALAIPQGFDVQPEARIMKDKIWEMLMMLDEHIARGHTGVLLKCGAVQYCYRLWAEDRNGKALAINRDRRGATAAVFQHMGINPSLYPELIRRLFPGQKHVRCYELYTMYVGAVPSQLVTAHNKRLVTELLDRRFEGLG